MQACSAASPDRSLRDGSGASNCQHLNASNGPRLRQPAFASSGRAGRRSRGDRSRLRASRLDAARMPARSPMRFMRLTHCSRSAFPVRRRIRRSSCSRRPWLRSRRQNRPTGRICQPMSSRTASSRTPSSRASSMPARRIRNFSPAPGRSMRRLTSWRRRPTTPRMPFAFAAAGSSATAPARARDGRSPASCSTTGSRAAAARSGSASPTS